MIRVSRFSSFLCVALAAAALGGVAGCGGSTPKAPGAAVQVSATPAPTDLPSGLKQQFVTAESDTLKALKTGGDQLKQLPDPATGAQVKQVLDPMVAATGAFDKQLKAMPWPSRSVAKVDAVVAADSAWIADADRLGGSATVTKADMSGSLGKDLIRQQAAIDQVRGDLGLPPL